MQADWELSQTLTSDGQGIRCAALLPTNNNAEDSNRVITGNQAGGLVEYKVPSGNLQVVSFQHDHSVTALLDGIDCYVTGCKDSIIRIFNNTDHTVKTTLEGHEKPVTSLAWADRKERYLLSGSWDGTVKVWNMQNHSLVATLPNHENSVCVAAVKQEGDVLTLATGSAGIAQNNTIAGHTTRIWQVDVATGDTHMLNAVANDHDGPIRDICTVGDGLLATCSNDGTVKIRDAQTGVTQSTLVFVQAQHPPMLLSLAVGDNFLAAAAEDGHVVVWEMQENGVTMGEPQVLRHAQCVWKVLALPEGDLATCSQDGMLRIFTRATERMASVQDRQAFAKEVQEAVQKTQNGPSPEEVAKLPHWEQNSTMRGRSEGQVQLFQKNGIAIAAQWSAASQTWIEVGEVTGQSETGTIDGIQYDHVFPIQVDQTGGGVASLQIGYNNGENPFAAAQRFIDAHVLPQHHLAEIADYISQRVGKRPATLGSEQHAVTGTPIALYQYLPMRSYTSFELSDKNAASTMEKMKKKIQEFGSYSDDDATLAAISSLMDTLVAENRYHSTQVSNEELKAISTMLTNFTPSQAFPALDLARLAVLHPDAASSGRQALWDGVIQRTVVLCNDPSGLEGPAVVAVPMLSLRLFANAFRGGPGSCRAATSHLGEILDCAAGQVKSSNKNIRGSVATLLYNVCFFLHQEKKGNVPFATQIVKIADGIINAKTYETEALFRAMVALGTIVMDSSEAKDAARALFLLAKVEPAASSHTEQVKTVATEIYSLLA